MTMLNNSCLVGRLTRDPELRYTGEGTPVAQFTVAVNRNFKNADGEYDADFINCVLWRKPAEVLSQYAHKGSLISVSGRLQSRSFENKDGNRIYVTEVVCENFNLLESKNSGNKAANNASLDALVDEVTQTAPAKQESTHQVYEQPTMQNSETGASMSEFGSVSNGTTVDISDDDLPF